MSRPTLALAACVLALQVAAPGAQQPPQQAPVFRAGTSIVPLTVSVLDKNRKPVTDLRQADFTVTENGVRQDIRSFFTVSLKPDAPTTAAAAAPIRGVQAEALAPQTRRAFLFVIGNGRLDVPTKAIDATMRFVREKLLPQDLVAIMAFDRVTELTTDHAFVAVVAERYQRGHEAILRAIKDFYGCAYCNLGVDLPPQIQSAIDTIFQPAGAPPREPPRSAATFALASPELKPEDRNPVPWMESDGFPTIRWNHRIVVQDIPKLYAALEYLRAIDGEKHVVWFTNSGLHDSVTHPELMVPPKPRTWGIDQDHRLAATAAHVRAVIDIVHTAGTPGPGFFPVSSAERATELSGGQFTGVEYAATALAWIDAATRSGYLLGYTSSNAPRDDGRREITVKVNRPGVTVLFKHGFSDQPDETPAEAEERLSQARLKSAAKSGEDADDLNVQMQAIAAPPPARGVTVTATIDASRVTFTRAGDLRVARLQVQVFCGDAKEKVIGQTSKELNLDVDEAAYQRYLTRGIPYSARIPIDGDARYVKIVVYDAAADRLGTALVKLK